MNAIKQFAVSKKEKLWSALLIVSCVCPLLYFLSCGGMFVPITPPWRLLFKTFFIVCYFTAGPIGFIAALSLVVLRKKQLRHNLILLMGLLLLCFLNMAVIPPIAHLFCANLGCRPIYGFLMCIFVFLLEKCYLGIVLI